MILYFSGTGNTRLVAESLALGLGEKIIDISRDKMPSEFEGENLGILFPVYSWGVPPLMLDFIKNLPDSFKQEILLKNIPVWSVCTCGDETGNAHLMIRDAVENTGLEFKGIWSVIMPNVYVILPGFNVDSKDVENKKLEQAPARIREITKKIISRDWETDVTVGSVPRIKTNVVYPLFVKYGINPRKWNVTEECVSCGRCVMACPVGNIRLGSGRPVWNDNCTSCLACYHICPTHAVEYGKRTVRKGQCRLPHSLLP